MTNTHQNLAKRWHTYRNEEEDRKRSNKGQNIIFIITVCILKLITYILDKVHCKKKRIVEKIPVE